MDKATLDKLLQAAVIAYRYPPQMPIREDTLLRHLDAIRTLLNMNRTAFKNAVRAIITDPLA